MNLSTEESDLDDKVVKKLNEDFGGDLTKLRNCDDINKKLNEEKNKIESLLFLNSDNVSTKISATIQHVQDTLEKIRNLSERHIKLNTSVDIYEKKVYKIKSMAEDYVNKINTLEKASDYLEVIKEIEEISNALEAGINEKNERKQIENYLKLHDINNSLSNTKCLHLLSYANEAIHFSHNILKDKLVTDYEEILKILKWPFVGSMLSNVQTKEVLNRFQILTEFLIQIQWNTQEATPSTLPSEFEALSLPVVQLIKPLKKRFIYHFMGSKQTNRPDKPEWYLTQILTWIKEHQDFIENNVQPVYIKLGIKKITAKVEFIRGLVQLAAEKLHHQLPNLCYDDSLFSHCIDEALGFDKELRNNFDYPKKQPGLIEVLTRAQIFVKWINIEKQFTLEKMDNIITSDTAFNTLVTNVSDDLQVTECGSSFIALLSTLTERYEMLPQPGHKLQFLELQLFLIDDFRVRLLQKLNQENSDPLSSKFPHILNTVNYVRNVLEEWGSTTGFIHLHFYQSKLNGKQEFDGSVFDEYLEVFGKMKDDLLDQLTDCVFMEVKAKSMPYRKDKWQAMESISNYLTPNITPTACPMFQILITKLHQLEEVLATSLFAASWKMLARRIDQYLYEEIVCLCFFNEGGASQFVYDITKGLFPLFGQYSKKPESNFKLLRDSCTVLSMSKGVALSLTESFTQKHEDGYDDNAILNNLGVYTLQKNDVLSILSRRIDLSKFLINHSNLNDQNLFSVQK